MDYPEISEYKTEVDIEKKLLAFNAILPILSGNEALMVSGSLAMKLSEKEVDGTVFVEKSDLDNIGDIDIIKSGARIDDVKLSFEAVSATYGFDTHVSLLHNNSAFEDSPLRELAIKEVDCTLETGEVGRPKRIQITTPEFNLLSLVSNQMVTDKTSPEKFRRKVLALQKHPKFSQDRFLQLAKYEIKTSREDYELTFNDWKNQVKQRGKLEKMELRLVEPFVDISQFNALIKSPKDVEGVNYSALRIVTPLERFVRDITEEEEGEGGDYL